MDFSLTDTSICRSANQAVCHISRDVKYDHTKRGLLTKRDKREHGGTKSSPFRSLEWKTCKRFMKPNLTLPNYQVGNVIKDTPNYFESLKQLPNILVKVSAKISCFFLTILFRASFFPHFFKHLMFMTECPMFICLCSIFSGSGLKTERAKITHALRKHSLTWPALLY